jgi:sodium/potassium/calcium exchanger 2
MFNIHRLPLPWLFGCVFFGHAIEVSNDGAVCSIGLIFVILISFVISLLGFKWTLKRGLGVILLFIYIMFVAVALAFQFGYVECPVAF